MKLGGGIRGPEGTRCGLLRPDIRGEFRGERLSYKYFAGAGGLESKGRVELEKSALSGIEASSGGVLARFLENL